MQIKIKNLFSVMATVLLLLNAIPTNVYADTDTTFVETTGDETKDVVITEDLSTYDTTLDIKANGNSELGLTGQNISSEESYGIVISAENNAHVTVEVQNIETMDDGVGINVEAGSEENPHVSITDIFPVFSPHISTIHKYSPFQFGPKKFFS